MSTSRTGDKKPTIFLRLYLSHLLMLAAIFLSGVLLIDYLFQDGIKYYLSKQPIIILPVVLGLIGIAGILAAWTAQGIAEPFSRIARALDSDDPVTKLRTMGGRSHNAESAWIHAAIRKYQETSASKTRKLRTYQHRAEAKNQIIVSLSPSLRIQSANLGAQIFTGKDSSALQYAPFIETFTSESNTEAIHTALQHAVSGEKQLYKVKVMGKDYAGGERAVFWSSVPIFDDGGVVTGLMLIGYEPGNKRTGKHDS